MKSSSELFVLLPLIMQLQLPMQRLLGLHDLGAGSFAGFCVDSLIFATFSFFFIELMWFVFRTKIVKLDSAYSFWGEFTKRVLTNFKASAIALIWVLFVSVMWATLTWGADFFAEKSVAQFRFYLTLSLLLNFYLAALFCVWHLFLAPRLAVSPHAKLNRNQ